MSSSFPQFPTTPQGTRKKRERNRERRSTQIIHFIIPLSLLISRDYFMFGPTKNMNLEVEQEYEDTIELTNKSSLPISVVITPSESFKYTLKFPIKTLQIQPNQNQKISCTLFLACTTTVCKLLLSPQKKDFKTS